MKQSFLLVVLSFCVFSQYTFSQEIVEAPEKYTAHNKGKFYIFWGGNRANYTKSDIRFVGKDYDFTIYDVEAHDKPKGWHMDYFNPSRIIRIILRHPRKLQLLMYLPQVVRKTVKSLLGGHVRISGRRRRPGNTSTNFN